MTNNSKSLLDIYELRCHDCNKIIGYVERYDLHHVIRCEDCQLKDTANNDI